MRASGSASALASTSSTVSSGPSHESGLTSTSSVVATLRQSCATPYEVPKGSGDLRVAAGLIGRFHDCEQLSRYAVCPLTSRGGILKFQSKTVLVRRAEALLGGLACTLGAVALTASTATTASAASGSGTTTANAAVASSITLSGLTSAFTLSGAPGTTATTAAPVTMNVLTNNRTGYAVTVQANAAQMVPATPATNTDTIAVSALQVRETGTTPYSAISATAPVTVHSQAVKSGATGDTVNNDFKMVMPFVNSDTYSVTLTYIATTL